jgi:hypothetical protein
VRPCWQAGVEPGSPLVREVEVAPNIATLRDGEISQESPRNALPELVTVAGRDGQRLIRKRRGLIETPKDDLGIGSVS